ncbi:UV DNA damage repair endonuclease UvsE [Bacillus piscicola]|uniref:UV DNA damage repair endonuclease UvsE n=1 Tax=Bacillus piscicola TaxID=1632684 RepID=UPI001F09304D
MTIVRLGYVAMSVHVKNASPSQTMTFTRFKEIPNRDAAKRKLERIAQSNLKNCLRLLQHNAAHDIHFFRLSSRLIPLADHEELTDWEYMPPLAADFEALGAYAKAHHMRLDFHPDHFVLLNSPREEVLKASLITLKLHYKMLKAMNLNPRHRAVMHIGGAYHDKEQALETFIENWGRVPQALQQMIMLENDDKSFTAEDALYLCEKLGIPLVFDLHHHLANHREPRWQESWERIIATWADSPLPLKMHISSPKSEKQFRAHHDHIEPEPFVRFLQDVRGSIDRLDCMIEAKKKDEALFQLVNDLKNVPWITWIDGTTFEM